MGGVIPQGYGDPLNFLRKVGQFMKQNGDERLTLKVFTAAVSQGDAILRGKPVRIKKLLKLINSYGKEPKLGLHISELSKVPLRVWGKPACEGDDEGPLPCDVGEEYHILDDVEFQKMRKHIEAVLAEAPAQPAPPA